MLAGKVWLPNSYLKLISILTYNELYNRWKFTSQEQSGEGSGTESAAGPMHLGLCLSAGQYPAAS